MKDILIVGNWKSNKTASVAREYLEEFAKIYKARPEVKVILCPSATSEEEVSNFVKTNGLAVEIGVQNISEHEEGADTGEISAAQAAEFAKYVIVGHSERRKMGETDEQVRRKFGMAKKHNLEAIVCVINERIPIPTGTDIVAYEPIEAIGTGNPDTPENAARVAAAIKAKTQGTIDILYGGSVTAENVHSFTNINEISGVLVGGASLNPQEFSSIIKNA